MVPYCPCPTQIAPAWGCQKEFTALHLCALMVEWVLHCLLVPCCHILVQVGICPLCRITVRILKICENI